MNKKLKLSVLSILAIIGLFAGGHTNVALADSVTASCNAATFYGTVTDVNGASMDAWFEWGRSSYAAQTPHQHFTTTSSYSETVTNLSEDTDYVGRAMAQDLNTGKIYTGNSLPFHTKPCQTTPPPQTCNDSAADNYHTGYPCHYPPTTCQDSAADNYHTGYPCHYPTQTCQDSSADNYHTGYPCHYPTQTCQDSAADNYHTGYPCHYPTLTCNDPLADNWHTGYPCHYTSGGTTVHVNLDADDTSISDGDSTKLRWDSTNADYCIASGGIHSWAGDRETDGTFNTGSLNDDETYRITCYNDNGGSANDSVTVRVSGSNNDNTDQPDVTTRNATNISTTSATLNGTVDGNGSSVRAWFEYGTNSNFGYTTASSSYGSSSTNYSKSVSGLYPNTLYYFRAVAENSNDTVYGSTLTFRTTGNNDVIVVNNQPTVVVYADSTNIAYGAATIIRWSSTNATSCVATGGSLGWAGVKNVGAGSFYTGSLTGSRTYSMTCTNNVGSSTDFVTVNVRGRTITTSTTVRPPASSYVVINSSIDRTQAIVPTIDNSRPHPGDEINYTVNYQNIGTGSITNLVLRMNLPQEVDYMFSNPSNPTIFGNTLTFNLGTLRANGSGTVTVRVRVRDNIPPGTPLNFPATLTYTDPSGFPQSVSANVSAEVFQEDKVTTDNTVQDDNTTRIGANVFAAGFLPTTFFGWLILLILLLVLVLLANHVYRQMTTPRVTSVQIDHH